MRNILGLLVRRLDGVNRGRSHDPYGWRTRSATTTVILIGAVTFPSIVGATVTQVAGADYVTDCEEAGVPIPPPFTYNEAVAGMSDWIVPGPLETVFSAPGLKTEMFYFVPSSGDGLCMTLPRSVTDVSGAPTGVALQGIICQGNRTSKACFWDLDFARFTDPLDLDDTVCLIPDPNDPLACDELILGGTDIDVPEDQICTNCHAGENTFVIHPETVLNLGVELLSADNWVDPIVQVGWPQNLGPANFYLPPASQNICTACHNGQVFNIAVAGQSIPSVAGRFPEISTENFRFCDTILEMATSGAQQTMPPSQLTTPPGFLGFLELEAACNQPPRAGRVARALYHQARQRGPSTFEVNLVNEMMDEGDVFEEIQDALVHPFFRKLPFIASAPTIDGTEDFEWSLYSRAHPIATPTIGGTVADNDISGQWRAMWNDTALYVFVEVTDDARKNDSGQLVWLDDSVEIYIDGRNEDVGSYDSNDAQFLFRPALSGASSCTDPVTTGGGRPGVSTAGIQYCWANVGTGPSYRVEVAIPWTTLGVTPGGQMGFEVHVNDDDDAASGRENQVSWRTLQTDAWTNPTRMTTVDVPSFFVESLGTSTPLIDGLANESDWLVSAAHFITRTPSPVAASNNTADWRSYWDEDNLYFFVSVNDSSLPTHNGPNPYDDDSVEIFIDANNSHRRFFDGHDDLQLIFKAGETNIVYFGDQSLDEPIELLSKSVFRTGGYDLEVAIPWQSLKTSPAEGGTFGVEVQINDDDGTPGTREGKLAWCSNSNETYRDPTYFCVGKLAGFGPVEPAIERTMRNNIALEPSITDVLASNTILNFDGFVGDPLWTSQPPRPLLFNILGAPTATASWRGAWNEEFLYFQFSVTESGPPISDSTNWYEDDSIEIYIDGNRGRGSSYDPLDAQYIVNPAFETVQLGFHSASASTDNVRVKSNIRTNGYDIEVALPWLALGMLGEDRARFGLEIQLNDDDVDASPNRVGKLAWFASSTIGDLAYARPDTFANVRLGE